MKNNRSSYIYYLYRWLAAYGIDLRKMWKSFRFTPRYLAAYFRYRHLAGLRSAEWPIALNYPQLSDWGEDGGSTRGHYFHQDLYVARRIQEVNPQRHIDVGSRVDGFVAHVAAFREIEVLDIRPNIPSVHRIKFAQCDLMNPPTGMENACDSLSCLHTLEHFGLGRYGDPLNPDGYRHGFAGLARLLKRDGILYFSTPIGRQRIEFNAHRVFAAETILELAKEWFSLEGFAYIDDDGNFHETAVGNIQTATGPLFYGCGIFEFKKVNPLSGSR